jgi:polyisoprenoid-binding protein YceI
VNVRYGTAVPTFDATSASCHILTFKEGMLSALAHDLEIAVSRFAITVTDDLAIDARFDARSLTVAHAMKDGRASDALGDGDKRKIEKTIASDVLDTGRYPEIAFVAPAPTVTDGRYAYRGQLTLHGKTRAVDVRSQVSGADQTVEVVLHQPDFGIKPYSAMMGTLKIKPDIRVRIRVPWPVQPASAP